MFSDKDDKSSHPSLTKSQQLGLLYKTSMLNCELVTLLFSDFVYFSQLLFPLFHYGCQVWGMHSPTNPSARKPCKQMEQTYMCYLKRICGVRHTTLNVILVQTHLSSLASFWWQQIFQFCNSSAPNSSIHKVVLLDERQFYHQKPFIFHFPFSMVDAS